MSPKVTVVPVQLPALLRLGYGWSVSAFLRCKPQLLRRVYTWTGGLWEVRKVKEVVEAGLDHVPGKAGSREHWPWTAASERV